MGLTWISNDKPLRRKYPVVRGTGRNAMSKISKNNSFTPFGLVVKTLVGVCSI